MNFSRFQGVLALVSLIALVVGCAALGGRDQRPRATAIVIPQDAPVDKTGNKQYPPQCDAACQKIWDGMSPEERTAHLITQVEVLDGEVNLQTRRADAAASAASAPSQGGCPTARPSTVTKKKSKQPTCGTPAAVAAPAASTASQPALPPDIGALVTAASTPSPWFADPVTERRPSKEVGAYNGWNVFGYRDWLLLYRPYPGFGPDKSVYMRHQQRDFGYVCSKLRVPETDRDLRIKVTAVISPSLNWELDFHHLISVYGAASKQHADTNIVSAEDVYAGAGTYIGQYQERLCQLAATRSLDDILRDPSLGEAEELNRYFRRDARAHFEVLVLLTKVDLTEDDYRVIGLKARMK